MSPYYGTHKGRRLGLKKGFLLGLLTLIICFGWSMILAAQANSPVEVFAQSVDVDINGHTTVFKGSVRILFSPYQARCNLATVVLNPKTQKVQKIVMDGNVVVEKGNQILKGKRITLFVPENRLKIEGQVYTRFQFEQGVNLNLN